MWYKKNEYILLLKAIPLRPVCNKKAKIKIWLIPNGSVVIDRIDQRAIKLSVQSESHS